jgi:hypothetical protein
LRKSLKNIFMTFLRNIFKRNPKEHFDFSDKIRLTSTNICDWPYYSRLLTEGKIKFDGKGRLRYLHGAPIGDLIAIQKKAGALTYKESAVEWFDPQSPKALEFKWP